ncbi:MAG: type VI secretion system baseplate subunit TssG [Myxococcales bacterium]|nr:type VI secretion system baseplate subunit TssG [Myxococcales bacterium]MCB9548697.1 type VI secretion system baseplate subunit TssG [Myxococcales bacterium]
MNFYQTVKLVEYLARRTSGRPVETPGSGEDPELEPVRFQSHASLGFSPSDMSRIDLKPVDNGLPVMRVDFLGLAGVRGPLPLFYTQLIRDRVRLGDTGLRDFIDMLNHRLVSLLWRLKQKHRPTLHTGPTHEHDFSRYLMALSGLYTDTAQEAFNHYPDNYDPEGDDHLLLSQDLIGYAGLFWAHDRSMRGLERILEHQFGFHVHGLQCQGHWIYLEPEARTALSTTMGHNALGVTAIAGRRVWDAQAGFRLDIGPLDWDVFVDFLPIGRRWDALLKLVRYYTRNAFSFTFRLAVDPGQVHRRRPGLSTQPAGPRLGWTSWLTTRPLRSKEARAGAVVTVTGRSHPLGEQGPAAGDAGDATQMADGA